MSRHRGAPPDWVSEEVFTDRDEAERWVFARRWELSTGLAEADDVPAGVVPGGPLPLTKQLLGYCDPMSVAHTDRIVEPAAHVHRLATGPQRILPPGPGFHKPAHEPVV